MIKIKIAMGNHGYLFTENKLNKKILLVKLK